MAWDGWFTYAGNEIINVQRTETYAERERTTWFRSAYRNTSLGPILGETYTSARQDDAPWTDPDFEESYDFLGAYPLSIAGLEDSTREASVTESVLDGGVVGRVRSGTRSVVFSVVLMGTSDAAVSYGMQWLAQALLGANCGPSGTCAGADLCYLAYEPLVDTTTGTTDAEDCLTPIIRTLRKVTFPDGPKITAKRTTTDGSAIWVIQFTAVAGMPFEFGAEIPVLEGFLDPNIVVPWAGGVIPEGGVIDLDGSIFTEVDCAPKVYEALYDPLCTPVTPPPGVPNVPLGCYDPPANWRRRQITIPKQFVPLWGEVVPKIDVHASVEMRNLRVRFYSDPFLIGSIEDDPCGYCGDFVISYVPPNHTLTFDGVEQTVTVLSPGGIRRRADSLVFATDGTPFEWPALSCGHGYIITLDLPQNQTPPVVDLALVSRAV